MIEAFSRAVNALRLSPHVASGAYFTFAAGTMIVRDDGIRFGDGQATAVKGP